MSVNEENTNHNFFFGFYVCIKNAKNNIKPQKTSLIIMSVNE